MAKGVRGRRRLVSRQSRTTPYPVPNWKQDMSECPSPSEKKCLDAIQHKKDWEDATCSVCMEYPHNAVLLLCSSYEKGCRAYMCGTSCRYSNCLDQYKKAYTKVHSPQQNQVLHGAPEDSSSFFSPPVSSGPVEKHGEVTELACPLCRGQVKGWTVLEAAREYLNAKKRTCMEDKCSFVGTYKELKRHVKSEHPSAKPREVDPAREQNWKRLERERERDDVISTVTSSMPGAVVFGDYVIERSPYGFDTSDEDEEDEDEDEDFNFTGLGRDDSNLVDVFLLFQALGRSGRNGGSSGGLRRRDEDGNGYTGTGRDDNDNSGSASLVTRLRRQGRTILSRSGRRRRQREANGGQT